MSLKKELMGKNVKDLSEVEVANLGNLDLNVCDKCGVVEDTNELYWLEYYYEGNKFPKKLLNKKGELKYVALCGGCMNNLRIYL